MRAGGHKQGKGKCPVHRVEGGPGRWGAGSASCLSGGPSGRRTKWTGLDEQRLGLGLRTPLSIPPCLESCLHLPSQAWPAASSLCSGYFCCLLLFPVGLPSPATPVPSSAENSWLLLTPQGVSSHSTCAGTRNTRKGSNPCRIIPPKHLGSSTHVPTRVFIHPPAHPLTDLAIHPPIYLYLPNKTYACSNTLI